MALQKNSQGFWLDADGNYPVFLHHAKLKGDTYVFSFSPYPMAQTETVISDTQYAYLPAEMFTVFTTRGWGRTLTDEEANKINGATKLTASPKEPEPIVPPVVETENDPPPPAGGKTVTKFGKDTK